ncbi:hypothetical protein EDB83DRAFT_2526816 [Lactarius deliciosus]|nr:hypothetical protein EDB83DRAFT_2526816 [Lactarius deliciosus]
MEATTEAALDFNKLSPFMLGAETNFNRPVGPTYGLNDRLNLMNPTLYAPLDMGQEHPFNGSNHGQLLVSSIPSCKMPDFPDIVLDGAGAMTTTVDNTGQASTGQGCSTDASVKPFRGTHRHTSPPSFVRAKKGPTRKESKEERTRRVVGLVGKLQTHPDYCNFQSQLHHVRDNLGAVKSWKLGVDFSRAYSRVHLVDGEYQKISKGELSQALSVSKTWLSNTNKPVRIMQMYGEGGTHHSQLFINKITSTAGVPEGSTKLLDWLKTWSKEHPV